MTKEEILNKIEELKKIKAESEFNAKLQDVFQHSYKIFLNSVYGFTGTQFSPIYNRDLAEAVTLTGQASTKEMVKYTNMCLNKLGKTSEDDEWIVAGDTDSCSPTSVINFNGRKICISDAFDKIIKDGGKINILKNGTEVAISNKLYKTDSINGSTFIKNISRHRVNKQMWKISIDNCNSLEITEDHSIMVLRDGNVIECKPIDIKSSDYLIIKNN